jgi:hypothetical protein
LVSEPVLVDG